MLLANISMIVSARLFILGEVLTLFDEQPPRRENARTTEFYYRIRVNTVDSTANEASIGRFLTPQELH